MLAAYRILSASGQTHVSVISNMASKSFLLPQEIAADMNLISVCVSDIIARVIAHSCTETGISRVYSDLFDIEGGSLRILRIPGTAGKSFGSVLRTMDGAVPVGVAADGQILLNPAPELRIPAEEKARRNRPEAVSAPMPAETPGQLSMEDMMTEETPEE